MMTNNLVHIFEQAGLGQAPYTFLHVSTMPSSCQYCSTPIIYQFWLRSADGRTFYVGSDCIHKSGDAGLAKVIDPILREHQRQLREKREQTILTMFATYVQATPNFWNDTFPGTHPNSYYASKGKTMGDYKQFCWEHSGSTKKVKMARGILISLGLLDDTKKKKVA